MITGITYGFPAAAVVGAAWFQSARKTEKAVNDTRADVAKTERAVEDTAREVAELRRENTDQHAANHEVAQESKRVVDGQALFLAELKGSIGEVNGKMDGIARQLTSEVRDGFIHVNNRLDAHGRRLSDLEASQQREDQVDG